MEHRGSLSFAWASKTRSGRHPASSPGRGRPVSSPHREGACGLREQSKFHVRSFIGFLCKPRKIKPLSLPSLLSLFADAVILREPLHPAGAGPRQHTLHRYLLHLKTFCFMMNLLPTIHSVYMKSQGKAKLNKNSPDTAKMLPDHPCVINQNLT